MRRDIELVPNRRGRGERVRRRMRQVLLAFLFIYGIRACLEFEPFVHEEHLRFARASRVESVQGVTGAILGSEDRCRRGARR